MYWRHRGARDKNHDLCVKATGKRRDVGFGGVDGDYLPQL